NARARILHSWREKFRARLRLSAPRRLRSDPTRVRAAHRQPATRPLREEGRVNLDWANGAALVPVISHWLHSNFRFTSPYRKGIPTMSHTLSRTAREPISERDAAWFEELADAVERGRISLLSRQPWSSQVGDTALSLMSLANAGQDGDSAECKVAI